MHAEQMIFLSLALPLAFGLLAARAGQAHRALFVACLGAQVTTALDAILAWQAFRHESLTAAAGWFRVDSLSAYHLLLMAAVYALSSAFAWIYLDQGREGLSLRQARMFGGLWCGSLAAMTLLLVSNNLGMMWVGMETTTLLTAFLISLHRSRASLEAMWKYVLICSVAVAFAFMGTLLVAAAASESHPGAPETLFWTRLLAEAARLDPRLMRVALVFLLVGYGTKAGLAPMHNWLPDAHSQAPAPVSALFSGFMLNAALYCILRFLPIIEAVPGCAGWAQGLLLGLGLISLLVGAGFILFQHDAKRLLAYCSVEHLGLIAIGVGLGGFGIFAALFHCLNHSLSKTLAFFSVGRIGQAYASHDITRMSGAFRASRVWATGLLAGFLALLGAAPLATFMSEIQILKAAFDGGRGVVLLLLLIGLAIAFVGMLRHTIRLAWARSDSAPRALATNSLDTVLVAAPLLLLLVLGLWLPGTLQTLIRDAASIVAGHPPEVPLARLLP